MSLASTRTAIVLVAPPYCVDGGDIDREGCVAVPVAMHRRPVEPDGAVRGDAVKLQFQVLPPIGRIQPDLAAIPRDSTLAIPL